MSGVQNIHREQLFQDGYTIIENQVGSDLLKKALSTINAALSKGMGTDEADSFVNGLQFPNLTMTTAITNLFNRSGAIHCISDLIGPIQAINFGQIALRFPGSACLEYIGDSSADFCPSPWWNTAWHIDGLPKPGQPELHHFTALVGVVLEDIPIDFMGNFIAYPGSHLLLQKYFRENGIERVAAEGYSALPKHLPFKEAKQVLAKAGDITIASYQLAHSIAPNTSAKIRYVVYFRIHSVRFAARQALRPECFTNIWHDWDGMQAFLRANPRGSKIRSLCVEPQPSAIDLEAARLQEQVETLFETRQYPACRAGLLRLCEIRRNNALHLFKAGVAFTIGASNEECQIGEPLIRKAIQLCPQIAGTRALLVKNLMQQRKLAEAVEAGEAMLKCPLIKLPANFTWVEILLTVALECTCKAYTDLGRAPEAQGFRERFLDKYLNFKDIAFGGAEDPSANRPSPRVPPRSGQAVSSTSTANGQAPTHPKKRADNIPALQLFKQGMAAIQTKNWTQGRSYFEQVIQIQNDNALVYILLAVCHTMDDSNTGASLAVGEGHLRRALELDPTLLVGYACLAINLDKQRRFDHCIQTANQMLSYRLNEAAEDWQEKVLLVALGAIRHAFVQLGKRQELLAYALTAQQRYPSIANKLRQI